MNKIVNIVFLSLLYLGITTLAFSQASVSPLRYSKSTLPDTTKSARFTESIPPHTASLRTHAIGDTIDLPFIDDFTTNKKKLNTNLWHTSGVTINNTNAINPPTPNVATFDGIDSTGSPYNFNNSFAYGACDQLVSKPINLGNLTAKDSVYLSFFWQAGGLVELPDSAQTDSISVFFKANTTQTWVKIWTYVPHDNTLDPTAFHLVFINIPDSLMYNGSQFKFQSFGNQSGAWDNWHIDYVRMDKNRNKDDTKYTDYGCANMSSKFFKNYTSITSEQLKGFEDKEIKDSLSISYFNFSGNRYTTDFKAILGVNKLNVDTIQIKNFIVPLFPNINPKTLAINKAKLNNLPDSCTLSFNSSSVRTLLDISPSNDESSIISTVSNYMAYDDGTAEGAFGINQAAGRVVYKIKLNRPDTLTAIDINWVKSVYNIEGTTFKLLIMPTLTSIQYSQQVLLNYGDSLNAFTRYKLDSGIVMRDSFYIGYEQNSATVLTVGYDKNEISNQHIYYAINYIAGTSLYNWKPFVKTAGSLMMRPVFEHISTNKLRLISNSNTINVYPNPSRGIFTIDNDTITQLKVFSLLGKEIPKEDYQFYYDDLNNKQIVDMTTLETGFYILYIYHDQMLTTKKIFIQP
jgi:hypothetical protein